jgi:TDG/mug DNA glycosylase family protein
MPTETIILNGCNIETLKELLRPGLKVVFVGLNPSPTSVECGHYYQGRHGKRFWTRLREYNLTPALPAGVEDDSAHECGYGFADLVRRPTRSSKDLTRAEKAAGVCDLAQRLSMTDDHPVIVFTYAEPWNLARAHLIDRGYCVLRMPGPYAARPLVDVIMKYLHYALGIPDANADN